jgi:tetratricopeptide (TPR) repeat protein
MLLDFLFGSIFGWWILFLLGLSLIAAIRGGYRMWLRNRRMMAATLAQAADPRNAAARFELARIQAERSRWKAALARIDEAIAIAAEDSRYNGVPHRFLRLRADCLYAIRDWKGAAIAYRKALEVPSDAGYGEALLGVARSELRAGRLR